MADAETAAGNPPPEDDVPGEKEANKTPSPKPDQDPPESKEVAPPLITVSKGKLCLPFNCSYIQITC